MDTSHVGKTCPFCLSPFKPSIQVTVCRECGMPHHQDCWQANGGCTTYGCARDGVQPAEPVVRSHAHRAPALHPVTSLDTLRGYHEPVSSRSHPLPLEVSLIGTLMLAWSALVTLLLGGFLLGNITDTGGLFNDLNLIFLLFGNLVLGVSGITLGIALLKRAGWARQGGIAWFICVAALQAATIGVFYLAGRNLPGVAWILPFLDFIGLSILSVAFLNSDRVKAGWSHAPAPPVPPSRIPPVLIFIGNYLFLHAGVVFFFYVDYFRLEGSYRNSSSYAYAYNGQVVLLLGICLCLLFLCCGIGVMRNIRWVRKSTAFLLFFAALSPLWVPTLLESVTFCQSIPELAYLLQPYFSQRIFWLHIFDAFFFLIMGIFLLVRTALPRPYPALRRRRSVQRTALR